MHRVSLTELSFQNELAIQELMNVFMDCLLAYFHHVSELDVSFLRGQIIHNMDKVYIILDEVLTNGVVAYTSRERALLPLQLLDAGS
ncbi:hypothetical protein EGW08_010483 [Elysia chlorotica]|uniref:AP complex mu/sigma subunit domain-containing protein n=1 Tax=Elysia chlorotica TaxID=188477 RepID=A0A3S1BIR2_ELYCH|nr:hypothetical protein EGW08_010483 [Elysia chlorotica]